MLFWDNLYRTGDLEAYLYHMEQAVASLLPYDNVEIYYFQDEREIVTNLDNYMDTLHFSPEINQYMAEAIIRGNNRLTENNYRQKFSLMKDFAYEIVHELILPYEDSIKIG